MIQEITSIQSQAYSSFYSTTVFSIIRSTKEEFNFLHFSRRIHFFTLQQYCPLSIIIACNCRHTSREERSDRNSHPEAFLGKGVLETCSNFTEEYPCRSVISIKLLCNLLHIFRTPFHKNTFGQLLLKRSIIPFYAFRLFSSSLQRLIQPAAAIGKRSLCFQISVKFVKVVLKSGIVKAATKNFLL